MVFVDSNVPMYLVGAAHPNRDLLHAFLGSQPDEVFVTSAEVYQEIVHRYVAADARPAIADAFEVLDALVTTVLEITRDDVDAAHRACLAQRLLSGRNCRHVAVMQRAGVTRVLTIDRGFDAWPGIQRLPR